MKIHLRRRGAIGQDKPGQSLNSFKLLATLSLPQSRNQRLERLWGGRRDLRNLGETLLGYKRTPISLPLLGFGIFLIVFSLDEAGFYWALYLVLESRQSLSS